MSEIKLLNVMILLQKLRSYRTMHDIVHTRQPLSAHARSWVGTQPRPYDQPLVSDVIHSAYSILSKPTVRLYLYTNCLTANMSGVKCRKWNLKSHFCGEPKREDLEIVEVELPAIKDGGQLNISVLLPVLLSI